MTKFVGPCKGRCLLVAASINSGTDDEPKTAQFDVETILASRIYKRSGNCFLPVVFVYFLLLFYRLLLPPPPPRLYLLSIDAIHRTN
ncbi:hypothetical protein TsFJ059_006653 [Trichoderma semiorbis]|uniref:Uncharacterized protein n=1 Tax=Trichoderma semiorbis TaxID=1491008 RepID=A0A9P8HBQ9_9HYPO|nr:hypothetical protein TsFJ059_006653 [Trichoderma semiorbis]